MKITTEAIYEEGVFRPLEPLEIPEHQKVELTVTTFDSEGDLDELWDRIGQRREEIFRRHGKLGDSTAMIREDRERR
jgi:predicted DNA-binding antitoxin AbrB/MazE fold protein